MIPANLSSVSANHILIVDDEPLVATALRVLFETLGMQVSTARNGQEAIELLSAIPFAAVITDLAMPGYNGMDLIAEIRRHDEGRLPIILLTADHEAVDRRDDTNNLQVLQKPTGVDQILAAMEQALQKTPNRRPPNHSRRGAQADGAKQDYSMADRQDLG